MKTPILFASHCLLNVCAKVSQDDPAKLAAEEALRRQFLAAAVAEGVQIVQLPCPELRLYGARRWGHAASQLDNPFFRDACRQMLAPLVQELQAYWERPEEYEVLGVVGVNGSPSCGVDFSFDGPWGGSVRDAGDARKIPERGVMIAVLRELLEERGIGVEMIGLDPSEPQAVMNLLLPAARRKLPMPSKERQSEPV